MTLLTVLLHIWILWSLYGDKVTAGQNQINCFCCYSEMSAGIYNCNVANNRCHPPDQPTTLESCTRYVQCEMMSNTGGRIDCILESAALCRNITCSCCDRACYAEKVCPTINADTYTCMKGNIVVVYCTNKVTTTTSFQTISSVEISTSTISHSVSAYSSSTDMMSHQMSYLSGQNHSSESTATFSSITHVTISPTESSKFNQRILFALVGGLGGIIIVLILSLIIMVQCVTLHRRRKMEEYPAIREGVCKMMTSSKKIFSFSQTEDEEKEYSNPEYAVIGITLLPAEPCQSTSVRGLEVQSCQLYAQVEDDRHQSKHRAGVTNLCAYEDIDKYFKSPNDEDYVNPGYEVSEKRGEKKQPQKNCNVQLPVTSTTHAVDKKEKLTIESTEYETVQN